VFAAYDATATVPRLRECRGRLRLLLRLVHYVIVRFVSNRLTCQRAMALKQLSPSGPMGRPQLCDTFSSCSRARWVAACKQAWTAGRRAKAASSQCKVVSKPSDLRTVA
jgi:hypothetical protein